MSRPIPILACNGSCVYARESILGKTLHNGSMSHRLRDIGNNRGMIMNNVSTCSRHGLYRNSRRLTHRNWLQRTTNRMD